MTPWQGIVDWRLTPAGREPAAMPPPLSNARYTAILAARRRGSRHGQHLGDEGMADDIAVAEPDHSDLGDRVEAAGDLREPRQAFEKVALVGVSGHDHCRVPAQPRQHHLDLPIGTVLRLVDDDEGGVQWA